MEALIQKMADKLDTGQERRAIMKNKEVFYSEEIIGREAETLRSLDKDTSLVNYNIQNKK